MAKDSSGLLFIQMVLELTFWAEREFPFLKKEASETAFLKVSICSCVADCTSCVTTQVTTSSHSGVVSEPL